LRDKRNGLKVLVRKPEGKRPLGRSRSRWEDNTKIDIKRDRLDWNGLDQFGSRWRPLVSAFNHGNDPLSSVKDG
jgi:hypothetical protein